jgi:hypothetical protein
MQPAGHKIRACCLDLLPLQVVDEDFFYFDLMLIAIFFHCS